MTAFDHASLMVVMPELFLACAGMILLVLGVFRAKRVGGTATGLVSWMAIGSFALAIIMVGAAPVDGIPVFNGGFVLDGFAVFAKVLILLGLIFSVLLSKQYLGQIKTEKFEYPVLMLFAGLGMMIMVSASDLLTLYMGLELQSLALYVLASIRRDHVKAAESGMKYFVLGAISSGMLLFGASLVYGVTGAISFAGINEALTGGVSLGAAIGMVFILAGLAFKISAVPFHMWTPDVYEGAPTSVTAFFAIVPKIAAICLLIRITAMAFPTMELQWMQVLWGLSLASMLVGALAGIAQNNIKRLMAYSSIGNMGYALIGVVSGTDEGVAATLIYMALYMIMTVGVFGIILTMRRDDRSAESLDDLAGLSRRSPPTAYALTALMFSMTGIPPMAGFFGKLFIFQAAVSQGFIVLAVLGVITSVIAGYYYLKIIKIMFFDEPAEKFDDNVAITTELPVFISLVITLGFIFKPNFLIDAAQSAASALFAAG